MTFRSNSLGDWAGGKPRFNLQRSLGAFLKFSQLKEALLQPGIAEGVTAILVGQDLLEVATFYRSSDQNLIPEVRLFSHHIHLARAVQGQTFEIGPGKDIEVFDISGAAVQPFFVRGKGLEIPGSAHIRLNFAGHQRGPGAFISAKVEIGMDGPGNGSYFGAGFSNCSDIIYGAGVAKFPQGWYRVALSGDISINLSASGLLRPGRKIAAPPPAASLDLFRAHASLYRGAGDYGSLSGGAYRCDQSDVSADANFCDASSDFGLSDEERDLTLMVYSAGGSASYFWQHIDCAATQVEAICLP